MADPYPQMPCGGCDAGTYSETPVMNGLRAFGDCASRKDALRMAPRCRKDDRHICFGARDWIVYRSFPLSEDDRKYIETLCQE